MAAHMSDAHELGHFLARRICEQESAVSDQLIRNEVKVLLVPAGVSGPQAARVVSG